MVLVSLAPPWMKAPLHHARSAQRALEGIFDQCAADAGCSRSFPDLQGDWRRLLARLAEGPVRAPYRPEKEGTATVLEIRRDVFGEAFRGLVGSKPWDVPYVIHRAAGGDFQPFFERIPLGKPSPFAEGLYLSISCTEGTSLITDQEAAEFSLDTFLGDYRVREQRQACREWPTGGVPATTQTLPRSTAPVLIISGTADNVTPPSWGREAAAQLGNARQVLIEGMPHNPEALSDLTCFDHIVTGFLKMPNPEAVDTSCLATLKAPPFLLREG
jgi:pimeloyl-ACP methyl ester carboxylesterase